MSPMILFPGALISEMSISILDVHSGDIVSIALEETDLCQNTPWLVQKIEGELNTTMGIPDGKKVHLQELYVGTTCINPKSQYTIEYYLLDGEVWIMNSVVVDNAMIDISISAWDGSRVYFKVKPETRIGKITEMYCNMQGICRERVFFMFDGGNMGDDSLVRDYDMEDGDAMEVFQVQLGGGCSGSPIEFADISKTSALKRMTWSKSAPPWRIARRGLCIEGRCTTKLCQAYSQNVIVNVGFGHWELEKYGQSCTCPICCGPVDVATCAFNNCRWKWVGKKVVSPSSPPVVVRGEWKEADDAYHRFEEKESGKAKWLLLKITTEPLGDGSSGVCAICLSSYSSSEGCGTLPCKHTYHSRCITEWLSRNPTCPLCRAMASMTTLMKKAAGLNY